MDGISGKNDPFTLEGSRTPKTFNTWAAPRLWGHLLKPTQIFKSNVKIYPTFSQMQNQHKRLVKVLFNPYDQTKNRNVFYVSILWKSTRNKRSLHIYRLPTKSTLYTCFVVYTLI